MNMNTEIEGLKESETQLLNEIESLEHNQALLKNARAETHKVLNQLYLATGRVSEIYPIDPVPISSNGRAKQGTRKRQLLQGFMAVSNGGEKPFTRTDVIEVFRVQGCDVPDSAIGTYLQLLKDTPLVSKVGRGQYEIDAEKVRHEIEDITREIEARVD